MDEYGIFELDVSIPIQKEIRPVFKEELDFFEMYRYWNYPDTDAPILWAEGIRKYVLNGTVIAEAKVRFFSCLHRNLASNDYCTFKRGYSTSALFSCFRQAFQ